MELTDALSAFLHHGALPFVGREQELRTLLEFWRSTVDAHSLRVVILTGEAGIGKSKLIQELGTRILSRAGMLVQAKLHPGLPSSITSIISQSLWTPRTSQRLLRNEPDGSLGSLAAALKRLARLRPTLVVVEDAHLLADDALAEFAQLLEMLSDEPISVICVTRPVNADIVRVLSRFMTGSLQLQGLTRTDLADLWSQIFRSQPPTETLKALRSATNGNSLAVRSALRSIAQSRQNSTTNYLEAPAKVLDDASLVRAITSNVRIFIEGLAAHLTDRECRAARTLALLGEVISLESAELMLAEERDEIDALLSHGVLAVSPTPLPTLPGATSNHPPLLFTHSLLHRHLVDTTTLSTDRLIRLILARPPLYSILPFELIGSAIEHPAITPQEVREFIKQALNVISDLDRTTSWKLGESIWPAVWNLFDRYVDCCEERRVLYAELLHIRLATMRRQDDTEEFLSLVNTMLEVTNEPIPKELVTYRILAFAYLHRHYWRVDYSRCERVWVNAMELAENHPEARLTKEFFFFLETAASAALVHDKRDRLVAIERQVGELLSSTDVDEAFRTMARGMICQHFVPLFNTPEELERRLALLTYLEQSSATFDAHLSVTRIVLAESIGEIDRMFAVCERMIPRFKEHGLLRNFYGCSLVRICGYAALGMGLVDVARRAEVLNAEAPPPIRPRLRRNTALRLLSIGILRGDLAWAQSVAERFPDILAEAMPEVRIALWLHTGLAPDSAELINDAHASRPLLRLGAVLLENVPADSIEFADICRSFLEEPILRLDDIMARIGLLAILRASPSESVEAKFALSLLPAAIVRTLQWLEAKRLCAYMKGLLDLTSPLLPPRQEKHWRKRVDEITKLREADLDRADPDRRVRLSMFGRITYRTNDAPAVAVRGARLRTVLGLMVANRIMDRPIGDPAFHAMVAGNEKDPDIARRTTAIAIHLLRSLLGSGVILTERSAPPRLNPLRCRVDLLEAHDSLREVDEALKTGLLVRAFSHITTALDLSKGDVPFPTLYDSLFESLREDFENRLRRGVVDVARTLLSEDDPIRAEELLRKGAAALPDDEEIVELLHETLKRLDKRVEAERLRARTESDR